MGRIYDNSEVRVYLLFYYLITIILNCIGKTGITFSVSTNHISFTSLLV